MMDCLLRIYASHSFYLKKKTNPNINMTPNPSPNPKLIKNNFFSE